MTNDAAICPNCGENMTEYEEGEGFFSFYEPATNLYDRMEGHMECPNCGGTIYVQADIREVERG